MIGYGCKKKGVRIVKTYAICNRKGGCGKSATAQALSNWLYRQGKRVLLVDVDNQANTSYTMGYDTDADAEMPTMYDVLAGDMPLKDVIRPVVRSDGTDLYWSIAPASEQLAAIDMRMTPVKVTLADAIKSVSRRYDYCIIDTPLSKGVLTMGALIAADEVIIPCVAEIYSVQGAQAIAKLIPNAKQYNPKLRVAGILITRHSDRLSIAQTVADMIAQTAQMIGTKVFATRIREGVAVREAAAYRMGLFDYDTKQRSVASADYVRFFEELMKGGK